MNENNKLMNIYLYGNLYNPNLGFSENAESDIIVYTETKREKRTIGSLEGFFFSFKQIDSGETIPLKRKEMKKFEDKYKGRFVPFN